MYDEKHELIATYRAMPVMLAALVQDLGDAVARPRADSGWSASEVVCHLLDGEQRTYERIIRIRDEERPSLPLYPVDDYRGRSLVDAVTAVGRLRQEHARLLEALEPAVWARTGLHEIEGELSILDITRHTAAHDAEHLSQIARGILHDQRAGKPVRPTNAGGRSRAFVA